MSKTDRLENEMKVKAKLMDFRRIPVTANVLNPTTEKQKIIFTQNRVDAVKHFYLGMTESSKLLKKIEIALAGQLIPQKLSGTLIEPDKTPARHVEVALDLFMGHYVTITDDNGAFTLHVQRGKIQFYPESKKLEFKIRGSNGIAKVQIETEKISSEGFMDTIQLPIRIEPLPVSIIESLRDMLGGRIEAQPEEEAEKPISEREVLLGDKDECATAYRTEYTIDRFPFEVFFRLVEPRTSTVASVSKVAIGEKFTVIPNWETGKSYSEETAAYVDRVPVEQPISVDGFRDRIVGVDGGTTVGTQENVPMAGTLGLGYIVRMAQSWKPKGYALGNLVYSLPLAPGEQQRVVIFERTDIAAVRESEFITAEEQQKYQELNDTSAQATATSAFKEAASGGSHFETEAESSSWSVGFIVAGGGGGSSNSRGDASSWMEGSRYTAQSAAERTHSAATRQAAARRSALRTSMRLAMASETQNVTTRVITNHNHTRALTLQYWEVLRLFEMSTSIEGVTLVCLVPLDVVRFLPPGQPLALYNENLVGNRSLVLQRYSLVLKHADVLARSLPHQHQYGLALLTQFAGDPTAKVEQAGGAAQDMIRIKLKGTFLPFEDLYVSALTRRGTRLGPIRLYGTPPTIPDLDTNKEQAFSTKEALLGYLRNLRNDRNVAVEYSANLPIPPSLARNDIVGFEISRQFRTYDYSLVNPLVMTSLFLKIPPSTGIALRTTTIRFSPNELERELGGPLVYSFQAALLKMTGSGSKTKAGIPKIGMTEVGLTEAGMTEGESYASSGLDGMELPPTMSVPARQLSPIIRYSQILEIERMLQHVVRNTVTYSKMIWLSLTPEERAIMLEGFTIGVPPDGISDESQMVPLLNCIENRVLGFYGNSMIMPFIIPTELAADPNMGITSGQVQDMLTEFHRNAFAPPKATIALPTRGVLGEAVLGHCSSAEKIDITRFWNWKDAPADVAPEIASVTVPTTQPSIAAGLTAPSTLTGMQPLINNVIAGTASPADVALLQTMIKAAAEQKGFSTELTGAAQLAPLVKTSQETAEKARADAMQYTRDVQELAIATLGNIYGASKGSPNAGSNALAALKGGKPAEEKKPEDKKPEDKKPEEKKTEKKTEGSNGDKPSGGGTVGNNT